jgi:hypothetical protein
MTPKWLLQLMWFGAGVGGTGALWYFLSQGMHRAAALTAFTTVVVVVIAVALHVRNDRIRSGYQPSTANPGSLPEQPTAKNSSPQASPITRGPNEPKIYLLEKSPNEVVVRINSHNPLERDLVAEQTYIGRWVRWSGEILSISSGSIFLKDGAFTVMVGDHVLGHARASLEFLAPERHLIEPLREGDRISYEAQITRVLDTAVYLTAVSVIPTEERSLVDVTPEHLMSFFEGRTDIQSKTLVADFIGRWMRVSGPLGNISGSSASPQVTFADQSPTHMFFRKKAWIERIAMMRPGDIITVVGQISYVERGNLVLDSCELLL